ncbi:hypothetical protein K435DRAFT_861910 [Dendrothele bispora CBS 962.96]|uniref:Uncharacterized protein n=1 Tax=Dendrothele bispora (strain CBS 962.96) TaxID=1314807 RepID=A0A4S8LV55_DENBC|nr:hypothetical protein K435DRAFT_861910 [Dendrothele bispora CBS 962.96]
MGKTTVPQKPTAGKNISTKPSKPSKPPKPSKPSTSKSQKDSATTNSTGSKRRHSSIDGSDEDTEDDNPPPFKRSKKDIKSVDTPHEKDRIFRSTFSKELTDQQILDKQWMSWKSTVYQHYHKPTILLDKGVVKYEFICKSTKTKLVQTRYDTSTTNLCNHRNSCEKQVAPPNEAITAYMGGGHYNHGEYRTWQAIWIARRSRPYCIIDDPEHKKMMTVVNPTIQLISSRTVTRDIIRIHDCTRCKSTF